MRQLVDDADQAPPLLAEVQERQAEQHREEQHLQNLALGEGVHDRRRNDVHQEVHGAEALRRGRVGGHRLRVERAGVGVDAGARLEDIDDDQANHERHRRDDLEVDQRADANAADVLHVAHARDPHDDGAEDDRCDDHPNEPDEAVAKRPHRRTGVGPEVAEHDSNGDAGQDLEVQMGVERLLRTVGHRQEPLRSRGILVSRARSVKRSGRDMKANEV